MSSDRSIPAWWGLRLLLLAAAAVCGLFFLPAGLLRQALAALAPDGEIEFLTVGLLLRLRLAAALSLAGLLLLFRAAGRRRAAVERTAGRLAAAGRRFGRSLGRDLARLAGCRPALAACLLGAALRLFFLGSPIRHDEAKTFFSFVARLLIDGLSNYYVPNNHILHTFFAHLAWRLFGDAPETLRLPALFAGCALLPLTFLAGLRLFEKRTATWATALVAICPPLVDYSTDARGYSLVAACGLASFWMLSGRASQPLAWAAAALFGALGLFAVPVAALPLAALFFHRLLAAPAGARGRTFFLAAAAGAGCLLLAAALYLPAMVRSGLRILLGNRYLEPLPFFEVLAGLPGLLLAQARFLTAGWLPAMALLALPLLALLLPAGHRLRKARRLAAAILLAIAAIVLAQRVLPKERVLLALAPLVVLAATRGSGELLLAAGALGGAGRRGRRRGLWLAPALAVAAAGALIVADPNASLECPEAEQLAALVAARREADARVLTATPAAGPLRYYLMRQGLPPETLAWAKSPPDPAPADRPLYLAIRRGSFSAADLGVRDPSDFALLAAGPTTSLYFRAAHRPAAAVAASDVSFAPP